MARMKDLAIDLENLQDAALAAAEELASKLQAISDFHWGTGTDCPIFRASEETLEALRAIETIIAVPMGEIECAK